MTTTHIPKSVKLLLYDIILDLTYVHTYNLKYIPMIFDCTNVT